MQIYVNPSSTCLYRRPHYAYTDTPFRVSVVNAGCVIIISIYQTDLLYCPKNSLYPLFSWHMRQTCSHLQCRCMCTKHIFFATFIKPQCTFKVPVTLFVRQLKTKLG